MNWTAVDSSILLPALCAGLLVLSTHIPMGIRVLDRGIIFIDLAIAQVAGLGVIVADSWALEMNGWGTQIAAASAAVVAAVLLNSLERRWAKIQEALIGILFVLAATGSIIVLSGNPHGGEHLKDLLVGQILFVTYTQLAAVALLYAAILALWWGYAARQGSIWFYVLFAAIVTASVQLVGIYLVFASLIIPALATRQSTGITRLMAGYGLGAAGYGLGLVLSALLDLPSGAVVVWSLAGLGLLLGTALGLRAARLKVMGSKVPE
jgi:zinc/manganese transport system permease protein